MTNALIRPQVDRNYLIWFKWHEFYQLKRIAMKMMVSWLETGVVNMLMERVQPAGTVQAGFRLCYFRLGSLINQSYKIHLKTFVSNNSSTVQEFWLSTSLLWTMLGFLSSFGDIVENDGYPCSICHQLFVRSRYRQYHDY